MPSSFDAMHDQIRPLALLDEPAPTHPTTATGAALASVLLIVLPVLAAALL